MIDNSVIKRLAIQCGFTPSLIFDAENRFNLFAQAVIENYKANLVPVAYQALCVEKNYALSTSKINLVGHHTDFWQRPLYALPSGETK